MKLVPEKLIVTCLDLACKLDPFLSQPFVAAAEVVAVAVIAAIAEAVEAAVAVAAAAARVVAVVAFVAVVVAADSIFVA